MIAAMNIRLPDVSPVSEIALAKTTGLLATKHTPKALLTFGGGPAAC
jgi:hypothetical protein